MKVPKIKWRVENNVTSSVNGIKIDNNAEMDVDEWINLFYGSKYFEMNRDIEKINKNAVIIVK